MSYYKENISLVFVVLTYRNTKDLNDFLLDIPQKLKCTYKIIVVNSFFDEESHLEFQRLSAEYNCDYIKIDNKGYGYGNNRGIDHARSMYKFEYLVVCNPDIEIQKFNIEKLMGLENNIVAPTIKTLSGKNQNPYYYKKIEFVEWTRYYAYKKGSKILLFIGLAINKLSRSLFLLTSLLIKRERRIYASHGSFVIFGHQALEKLGEVYDEKMFLFAEENHLARLALKNSIKTLMIPAIKILHKEDGSVGLENEKMAGIMKKSFIHYYEKWKVSQ